MRPETIEAVCFDFDGTLADTEPLGIELDLEAYRSFGLEVPLEEAHTVCGTDGKASVEAILANHGRPDLTAEDFEARRRPSSQIYRSMGLTVFPGAFECVRSLRAAGVKCAVVSTTAACDLAYGLSRIGAMDCFDAMVAGDMVEHRKPAPDPYLLALSFLGVDASRAIAVDDSPVGIASAKAAGLHVVAFTGSEIRQDTSAADETLAAWPLDLGL